LKVKSERFKLIKYKKEEAGFIRLDEIEIVVVLLACLLAGSLTA
jgi:hypothetical protein